MFNCPACQKHIVLNSMHELRKHVNRHFKKFQLEIPFKCIQSEKCKFETSVAWKLVDHFRRKHFDGIFCDCSNEAEHISPHEHNSHNTLFVNELINSPSIPEPDTEDNEEIVDKVVDEDFEQVIDYSRKVMSPEIEHLQQSLEEELFERIISFRSNNCIPLSVTKDVMKMAEVIVTKVVNVAMSIVNFHINNMADVDNVSMIASVVEEFTE